MDSSAPPTPLLGAGEKCCDTHVHVFGPVERFPLIPGATLPPHGSPEEYLANVHPLGVKRHVFVQPSTYGQDNEAQLYATEMVGDEARAIVALPESVTDAEIATMHRRGARGVRLSATLTEPPTAERLAWMTQRIETFDARLAGSDWCIELLIPGWMTEGLLPVLQKVKTNFVLCHGGMFAAPLGTSQPGFAGLLHLMQAGYCWIKLTGVLRWSASDTFDDTFPLVHALAKAAPDRLIWGTDHPHINAVKKIPNSDLLALLGRWFPDMGMRRKILVTNPEALFGFAPAA